MNRLLVLGNSHLISFKQAWDCMSSDSLRQGCLNGIKPDWVFRNWLNVGIDPADKSNFLRSFSYNQSSPLVRQNRLDQTPDYRAAAAQSVDLILIGLGAMGEGMHQRWGTLDDLKIGLMVQEECPDDCEDLGSVPVSRSLVTAIYSAHNSFRISFLNKVLEAEHIRRVIWIASPNLCSSVVRKAAGEYQLVSGNIGRHYALNDQIWTSCLTEYLSEKSINTSKLTFINPNKDKTDEFGCLDDRFMISETDNHASKEFYLSGMKDLLELLVSQPSSMNSV